MRPVEKRVYFLKVECGSDDLGDILTSIDHQSHASLFSYVDDQGGGIYLSSLESQSDMYKGILARVRMNDLPRIATLGQRPTHTLSIAENEGIAELTHFIYFKSSKILAIEYNHYGPRANTLQTYVINQTNELRGEPLGLTFQYIFDENTLGLLAEGSEIRLLDIAIPKANIGTLAQFDTNIYEAFENASHFGEGGEVEIIIRSSRRRNAADAAAISQGLLAKTRHLVTLPPGTLSKLKARIKPSDDTVQHADLLENKFVSTLLLQPTTRERVIDSNEFFGAIQTAYQDQRELLRRLSEHETFE